MELESIYIAGDFAVRGSFKKVKGGFAGEKFILENENGVINASNLVASGYPFFAGSMKFSTQLEFNPGNGAGQEKVFLKFDGFDAVAAKVRLNGKDAGLIFLPPYELDVTQYVSVGKNELEIELVNTLRNLLGPHHLRDFNPTWVGPNEFKQEKGRWTPRYNFVPFGLGKVSLVSK